MHKIRKILDFELSIAGFLQILIAFSVTLFAIGLFSVGPSWMVDHTTFVLALVLFGILAVALRRAPPGALPILLALTFHFAFFYFPRLVQYLYIPDQIATPFFLPLPAERINRAFFYVVLAVFALIIGVFSGDALTERFTKWGRPMEASTDLEKPTLKSLGLIFFFAALIEFIFVAVLQLTPFRNVHFGPFHSFVMALRTLVNLDTAYIFTAGVLFLRGLRNGRHLAFFFAVSFVYWLFTILSGSKSGIFRIDQIIFVLTVIALGKALIRLRTWLVISVVTLVLGPVAFVISANLREAYRAGEPLPLIEAPVEKLVHVADGEQAARYQTRPPGTQEQKGWAWLRATPFWSENVAPTLNPVLPILNRFGLIDYSLHVVYYSYRQDMKGKYFSGEYLLKSAANSLLPGTPFAEAKYDTSRISRIVYHSFSEESLEDQRNYSTDPWTAWGIASMYFGYGGGLAFLFLIGLAFQMGLRGIASRTPLTPQVNAGLFLWGVVMVFFTNFGMDMWIVTILFLALQFGLLNVTARGLDRVFLKSRARPS